MSNRAQHIILGAILISIALMDCQPALATAISYNFTETGWVNTAGTTESLSGSFKGAPGANGDLTLSDLTGFSATMTESNGVNRKTIATFSSVTDFLFTVSSNALALFSTGIPASSLCLGDTVQQGLCGPVTPPPVSRTGVQAPPLEGLFTFSVNGALDAGTTSTTNVTPGPVVIGSAPAPVATPEAASFLLCGAALILLSIGLSFLPQRRARVD